MSNTDNTLPEELQKEINRLAKDYSDKKISEYFRNTWLYTEAFLGYIAGATEYASKLQQLQQQQALALDLLDSVYGQDQEYGCITSELSKQIKSFLDGSK